MRVRPTNEPGTLAAGRSARPMAGATTWTAARKSVEPKTRPALPAAARECDEAYMREALELARQAIAAEEVPVGAVLVQDGRVVGRGSNRPIGACDPTAHAEIVAIREAASHAGNYRLTGAELYVTLEPCVMCLGAAIHARLGRVVFGAADPRVGAADLLRDRKTPAPFNHGFEIVGGVLAEESAKVLRTFFADRRFPLGLSSRRRDPGLVVLSADYEGPVPDPDSHLSDRPEPC